MLTPRGLYAVSIHAFRGEGDRLAEGLKVPGRMFQSTPSGGKATDDDNNHNRKRHVSIHAFRGEGDITIRTNRAYLIVSIHAFRGEGDQHRA